MVSDTQREIAEVLAALYENGHVDLVLCDRVAALLEQLGQVPPWLEGLLARLDENEETLKILTKRPPRHRRETR